MTTREHPSGERLIPGRRLRCVLCKDPIVFARTVRSETGRGGKMMPLNPTTDAAGNVAVRVIDSTRGILTARVLGADDGLDTHTELRAMPHFATCKGAGRNIAKDAEAFLADLTRGGDDQ